MKAHKNLFAISSPLLAAVLALGAAGCDDDGGTKSTVNAPKVSAASTSPTTPTSSKAAPNIAAPILAGDATHGGVESSPTHEGFLAATQRGRVEVADANPPTLIALEGLPHAEDGKDYLAEGDALIELGRTGEAIVSYRHALFDHDDAKVWKKLGRTYLEAGQIQRGVDVLEHVVSLGQDTEVRRQLIGAHTDLGQLEAARSHAEHVALHRPDDARAHYVLGRTYMKSSMWREAVQAFQKSTEIRPQNIWAHNNLGYSALQIGENELAVTHLENCLDLEGVQPTMLNNLGVAYERLGRQAEALAAFTFATDLKKGYVNAAINRDRLAKALTEDDRSLAAEVLDDMKAPLGDASFAAVAEVSAE